LDKDRKKADIEMETNIYDVVEEHHNCFVQILRNTVTGEVSFGWRKENEDEGDTF
jgi:hypothetical protein